MKVIARKIIPDTSGEYEVHLLEGIFGYPFRIWSNKSNLYLKNTTRFGSNIVTPTSTYGIRFTSGEHEDVQTKMYLKKLVEMVGFE